MRPRPAELTENGTYRVPDAGSDPGDPALAASTGPLLEVAVVDLEPYDLSVVGLLVHSPVRGQLIEQPKSPTAGLARSPPDRRVRTVIVNLSQ